METDLSVQGSMGNRALSPENNDWLGLESVLRRVACGGMLAENGDRLILFALFEGSCQISRLV